MSEKSEKKTAKVEPPKAIIFKCQFCGEEKPFDELVILRQFYPILSCCRECGKGPITESMLESNN